MYKDERERWQNRLEAAWIEIGERSKKTDSVFTARVADVSSAKGVVADGCWLLLLSCIVSPAPFVVSRYLVVNDVTADNLTKALIAIALRQFASLNLITRVYVTIPFVLLSSLVLHKML